MQKKKIIVISLITFFVGMGFQPVFASSTNTIVVNKSPLELIIDGPTYGIVGVTYDYTFWITEGGCTFSLYIDWRDGNIEDWDGPYSSPQTKSHILSESGTYNIKAKAHVINGS